MAKQNPAHPYTVILGGPHGLITLRYVEGVDEYAAIEAARATLGRSDGSSWAPAYVFAGHQQDVLSRALPALAKSEKAA